MEGLGPPPPAPGLSFPCRGIHEAGLLPLLPRLRKAPGSRGPRSENASRRSTIWRDRPRRLSAGCSGGTQGYDLAQQAEEAERWLPPRSWATQATAGRSFMVALQAATQAQARLYTREPAIIPCPLTTYTNTVAPNSQLTNDDNVNNHSCS